MLTYTFWEIILDQNSLQESHTIGASLIPALAFCKSWQKFAFILDYYITMVSQLGSQMAQLQFGVWGSEHKLISQCIIILLDLLFHILHYHYLNQHYHYLNLALSCITMLLDMFFDGAAFIFCMETTSYNIVTSLQVLWELAIFATGWKLEQLTEIN